MRKAAPIRLVGALALAAGTPLGLLPSRHNTAARHGPVGTNVLAAPASSLAPPGPLARASTCRSHHGQWSCTSPCEGRHLRPARARARCLALAIGALEAGRRAEELPQLALPDDYGRLSTPERLFVLVNLERIARGVPPLVGLSAALDTVAQVAAATRRDPTPAATDAALPALSMGAAWAGGQANAAAAVFAWIYADGWAGHATTNVDCGAPAAPGCWEHRRILLGQATGSTCQSCVAGSAATVTTVGRAERSYAFVIDHPRVRPRLTFTWNRDVLPHLSARAEQILAH